MSELIRRINEKIISEPDFTVIVDQGENNSFTYAQLDLYARRIACKLRRMGVQPRDFYHSVLNDTSNRHFRHVDSKYADTLISYLPRTGGNVKDEIIAAEVSISAVMKQLNRAFGITALMVIFFTVVMLVIFAIIIHKRVQNPAKIISQKMSSFVHDRKKGYEKLEVKGSKEFTDGKFYSTERLEEKLTACIDSDSSETLNDILSDLNGFTEGAEQNDDITMLTLRVKPQRTETVLRLSSQIPQLVVIKEAIEKTDLSDRLKNKLILAAEEMFVNICSYAYDTVGEVEVRIATDQSMAELTFIDGGKPFDPTVELPDIDDYDYENTIGGLGRFLTFTMSDGYSYEYRDEKNILTIIYKRGD